MIDRIAIKLYSATQAHKAIMAAWHTIKPWLIAGHRLMLTIEPATRSNEQNAKLHAILTEIASQKEWAGARRDLDTWKRLVTAAWLRARGESVEILPALDGRGVDVVFRRTSKLSVDECSELIEFVHAWAADNEIKLSQ